MDLALDSAFGKAINDKNLNSEIETHTDGLSVGGFGLSINDKNLNSEIETEWI